MRRLLACLTAVLLAAWVVTLHAIVPGLGQHVANDISGASIVNTIASGVTDGSAMIVGIAQSASDADQSYSVADNKGNTYTSVVGPIRTTGANGNRACQIFVAKNITTGGTGAVTITTTVTLGAVGSAAQAVEVTGADTTSPVFATDSVAESADHTSDHAAAVSLTTSTEHFTYSIMALNSTSTFTPTTGFTTLAGDFSATTKASQRLVSGSPLSANPLTWVSGSARTAANCTVSIQPPASAGGAAPRCSLLGVCP